MNPHQEPGGEPGDFKTYLMTGPQTEDVEIERDEASAAVVDLE